MFNCKDSACTEAVLKSPKYTHFQEIWTKIFLLKPNLATYSRNGQMSDLLQSATKYKIWYITNLNKGQFVQL